LARLRPTRVTELGLAAAIGDLETFWRARRPEVALDVELAAEELVPEPLWDTAYRVVQEALSNAMRHGDARKVEVSVRLGDDREVMVRIADDGARRESDPDGGGYGLIGMRERVRASGGVLTIEAGETGWVVSARLRTPADPDNAEAA
jgi:two-component system sensor histidine kinase UhpB